MSVVLEKFHLYVPSTDSAKQIFNHGFGLKIIKEKVLDSGSGSVSFELNGGTILFCLEQGAQSKNLNAYSNSINLVASASEIEKAYEVLNEGNFDIKLSKLNFAGKELLQLHIATNVPSTFITVAEHY